MLQKLVLACVLAVIAVPGMACDLTVGVVPQFEARRTSKIWVPILDKIAEQTGCNLKLRGSGSIPEFEDQFKSGLFDIAYMNPYHAILAHDAQGYVPVVRSGKRALQGILVVPKDSDYQDVADLNGTEIAFPSPNALGASLLMRAELRAVHGVKFVPNYVGTHSSVYINVFKGLTAAGGGVGRTLAAQDEVLSSGLRVLYKTQKVPAHPIVVHPRLDAEMVETLTNLFLDTQLDGDGLLVDVPMADPIPASIDDYALLKDLNLETFVE